MPVEFLNDEQAAAYGRFPGGLTPTELEGLFFLDDFDRDLVARRRGDENRIGFGLQVATVRALGTFLADPLEVPTEAVDYIAGQVGAADPSAAKGYLRREKTRFEHQWEIARAYGYSDFAGAEPDLVRWIDDRAWTTGDGPKAIFDATVGWLRERKVLLPAVSTLAGWSRRSGRRPRTGCISGCPSWSQPSRPGCWRICSTCRTAPGSLRWRGYGRR